MGQGDNQIVAVKPNPAFANYFTAASEVRATHPKAARNTGATGVRRAFVASGILRSGCSQFVRRLRHGKHAWIRGDRRRHGR